MLCSPRVLLFCGSFCNGDGSAELIDDGSLFLFDGILVLVVGFSCCCSFSLILMGIDVLDCCGVILRYLDDGNDEGTCNFDDFCLADCDIIFSVLMFSVAGGFFRAELPVGESRFVRIVESGNDGIFDCGVFDRDCCLMFGVCIALL